MHEYHKAVEWIEKANQAVADKGATKARILKVTIGEASDYSPEVIKSYFDEAAEGTPCEGASFDVTISRCMLKCPQCGKLFEKKLLDYKCSECGVEGNPTDSGNEVLLDEVICE